MELLNAKIIPTQQGMETYLDIPENITVADLNTPNRNNPFLDLKIGIEYYRLCDQHYYESEINFFWLRIHPESKSITLLETDIQSLFSVKNDSEKEATKELIGVWLINSHAFKQAIRQLINQKRAENVTTEQEIKETLQTIELLEKTLDLKTENILNASLEKYH